MNLSKSLWTKLITIGLGATMALGVGLTASKVASNEVKAAQKTATQVTDASTLKAGDLLIITNSAGTYALSTTQNSNNRGQVACSINGTTLTYDDASTEVFELGGSAGSWTLETTVGSTEGYIYAASSSSNNLRTRTTLGNGSYWAITVNGDDMDLKADYYSRNWLRWNSSNSLFSAYGSGQAATKLFRIEASGKTLTGISVSGTPNKKTYYSGESFDPNGITVTATYSDAPSANVTAGCSYSPDPLTVGTTFVTVSYTEGVTKTTTISGLTVTAPSYSIVTYDLTSKNTFTTSGNAPSDSNASIVEAYSTSKQMTSGNSQTVTLSGYTNVKITKITLSMKSNASSGAGGFTYAADGGSATSIVSSGTAFNNANWYGDWSGSYVDVVKNVNIKVSSSVVLVISATANSLYCQSYTIQWEELEVVSLSSIAITTPQTKTAYYNGDTFDHAGMVVTATYSDNSTAAVSYDASGEAGYNYSTAALVTGATTHTISYTYEGVTKTENASITVSAVVLTNISVTGILEKTTYLVGQSFDPYGLTITATRNNGSTANVTGSTTFTPDPLTAGLTSVTASYTEGAVTKTAIISGLTVNDKSLISIAASGTLSKTSYFAGENFDPSGLTFTAHYDDSSSRTLEVGELTFSPTPLTAGTTSVTVTFDNGVTQKSTSVSGLTVTAIVLNSITIKTAASKTNFKLGETFSYSGLVINANYNSETVEMTSGFSVTGVDTMVLGAQTATVTYESKTVTYSVDVTNQGAAVSYTIPGVASDLFISEYVEGSSGTNKALEIYNGTGSTIDLSAYSLKIGTNGGSLGNTLALSGSLANGEVYVVYNSGADLSDITANGDLVNNTIANFNGDDSIGLFNDGTLIDLIGVEGTDPGSAWTSGTKSTANQALRRAASVSSPNTTFTWAEWESYADSASNLSTHVMDLDDILVPGDVTAQQQATAFANYVMTGIGLNAQGSCAAVKSELDAEYGYMAADSKTIFTSSSDALFVNARARMAYLTAWVASQGQGSGFSINSNNTSRTALISITLISIIGLSTVAGFYFLRKKKETF